MYTSVLSQKSNL